MCQFICQDYTITMYLNQYWRDERLAFHAFASFGDASSSNYNDLLTLSGDFAEKIWVPDTFFANDKNRYTMLIIVDLLIAFYSGLILDSLYFTASCTMSLNEINWCAWLAMER